MKPGSQNFAHVEGRLLYAPRVNPTAGGSGVTNMTIEVPTGFKDHTVRIGVVCWHRETKPPEGLVEGDYIVAEGRIAVRSYEKSSEGVKAQVYVTEIVAESIDAPKHKRAGTLAKAIPKARPLGDDGGF